MSKELEKTAGAESYIDKLIHEELRNGVYSREICTRFPPEPNGYLHIGSAYANPFELHDCQEIQGELQPEIR